MSLRRPSLPLLAAAWLVQPAALASQHRDTVAAGTRYDAGSLHRFVLGASYRDLWTAPVAVPVLDLSTFAGGLTPTRRGGGNQTRSLRFRGADGREYAFRSVDKYPATALPKDLQGTLVSWAVRDQVSSLVPAGGIAAHAIEDAAGLPHLTEVLYRMPDDPRLGEFRQEFAGMLGTMEERPEAGRTRLPGLAGAARIEGTDEFLEILESAPTERLDDRGYLAARLVDFLINDWDRHADQYLRARFDQPGGVHLWRAVPRDRDYAFVDYDGLGLTLAHVVVWNTARFGEHIELRSLLLNASPMDHRLLGGVDRPSWEAVTREVRARLSDAALEAAVATLPAEYRRLRGAELVRVLKARRDDLERASLDFYGIIAREPQAHATDRDDAATIERLPDGNAWVTIAPAGGGAPIYRRWFNWVETREVRVFLHGGNDVARVTGSGPEQMIVRVIGGKGDDNLRDESRTGRRTAFYDSDGENRYTRRPRTRVDEKEWKQEKWEPGGGTLPPRDWGGSASAFSPSFGWRPAGVGPFVGVGPQWMRYGFRRTPYAMRQQVRFMWAVEHGRFGAEYLGDFRYVGRPMDKTLLLARASAMEASRFPGFGNDTHIGSEEDNDRFRVFEHQLLGNAAVWRGIGRGAWVVGELTGRFTDPEIDAGTPVAGERPRGAADFAVVGGRAGLVFERTDSTAYRRSGWTLETWGTGFPLAFHDAEAFGRARAVGTTYLSAGGGGPTLALRAGGERVWGGFPFQYSAFLGGGGTLRGYRSQRFAGDASAFGSAELRQVVTRAKLIVRGDLGVLALGDAGRVWYRGESPGGWHTAYGAGLFFAFLDRKRAVSATWARGERDSFYVMLGMPF